MAASPLIAGCLGGRRQQPYPDPRALPRRTSTPNPTSTPLQVHQRQPLPLGPELRHDDVLGPDRCANASTDLLVQHLPHPHPPAHRSQSSTPAARSTAAASASTALAPAASLATNQLRAVSLPATLVAAGMPCRPTGGCRFVWRTGTTCRQLCWGSLSKSCGAFCTQASRSCTGIGALPPQALATAPRLGPAPPARSVPAWCQPACLACLSGPCARHSCLPADGGVVKACPRQEFTNGDEVCLRKVLTVAVPDSKLTINVADNGLIKGTASYCPGERRG